MLLTRNSPFLEHDDGICFEVREVDGFPETDNVGMFAHHEPADVGEEEASGGVVGVSVGVAVLVVLPVVSDPNVQAVLQITISVILKL